MPDHEVSLNFVSGNQKTTIRCTCGVICGTVSTGTRISEIMMIFQEHLPKENNG